MNEEILIKEAYALIRKKERQHYVICFLKFYDTTLNLSEDPLLLREIPHTQPIRLAGFEMLPGTRQVLYHAENESHAQLLLESFVQGGAYVVNNERINFEAVSLSKELETLTDELISKYNDIPLARGQQIPGRKVRD